MRPCSVGGNQRTYEYRGVKVAALASGAQSVLVSAAHSLVSIRVPPLHVPPPTPSLPSLGRCVTPIATAPLPDAPRWTDSVWVPTVHDSSLCQTVSQSPTGPPICRRICDERATMADPSG
eukprot:GHVU01069541.1.p1 GENE.GHVU01069541.1~~GHVU01069541.1.p1  ORF type:complete len:120 (+),score=1.99 GHVU01069541.1:182-541(+)